MKTKIFFRERGNQVLLASLVADENSPKCSTCVTSTTTDTSEVVSGKKHYARGGGGIK